MDHRVFADKANLKITSVYKEDAGVYQCFVQFQNGSNHQATAELRLGGTQYIFKLRGPGTGYFFFDKLKQHSLVDFNE